MKLPLLSHDGRLLPRSQENALHDAASYGTAVFHKMTRTLVARASSTCQPGNNSPECQKPTDSTSTQTLPIVLGAIIPISCAIVVFIFLHRRNKKKQALEDMNDPHKSLDFGVGLNGGPANRKKRPFGKGEPPEMIITELGPDPMRPGKKRGGMSMDMLGSPYLLPAGLQGSGESLHSMSRAMHDQHDPYRPVTMMRDSSETSRTPRQFNENASVYSASTFQTGNDKSNLLTNAQSMSTSYPNRSGSMSQADSTTDFSTREMHSSSRSTPGSRKASMSSSNPGLANISESGTFQSSRTDSLPPLPPPPEPEAFEQHVPPPRTTSISVDRPPRKSSVSHKARPVFNRASDASFYGEDDDQEPPPPPPKLMEPEDWSHGPLSEEPAVMYSGRFSIDTPAPSQQYPVPTENNRLSVMQAGNRMSVMGVRPLPPSNPEDNPEQRANRIRSFYKEYFDDSRPNPAGAFYEDWDPAYLETAIYDPETGEYIYPNAYPEPAFAQPMGRRAMTPPPGGIGRMQGMDHARHYSTMSGGRATIGGPRPGPRQPPKKKLPPPKPLMSLPTPHMLKGDDAFYNAMDFAPPTSFREVQNGRRPDSPMGVQRPYSPAVKAYSPLVPAFDELAVMPSPHHLRKSGTFTALDFAPPKFRGTEGRDSDAGSIRSARSGISAMQLDAVRAGAYRVSRIPKEFVTSREDLSTQLRPKLNMISPA